MGNSAVKEAAAAAYRVGLTPSLRIGNGGSDANWLVRHGIPTVSLGCGTHNAHTIEEYVSVDEFSAACRLALELVKG